MAQRTLFSDQQFLQEESLSRAQNVADEKEKEQKVPHTAQKDSSQKFHMGWPYGCVSETQGMQSTIAIVDIPVA